MPRVLTEAFLYKHEWHWTFVSVHHIIRLVKRRDSSVVLPMIPSEHYAIMRQRFWTVCLCVENWTVTYKWGEFCCICLKAQKSQWRSVWRQTFVAFLFVRHRIRIGITACYKRGLMNGTGGKIWLIIQFAIWHKNPSKIIRGAAKWIICRALCIKNSFIIDCPWLPNNIEVYYGMQRG